MPIPFIHCSVIYRSAKIGDMDKIAIAVRKGVFNNSTTFTAPTILQPDFQLLIDAYVNTRADYTKGGLQQKGPFMTAKDNLIEGLDTLATYVDSVAMGDANIILLSNFTPTNVDESQGHIPTQPEGVDIERGVPGEMFAECLPIEGAIYYGCIVVANHPLDEDFIISALGQIVITEDGIQPPLPPADPIMGDYVKFVLDLNKQRKKHFVGLKVKVTYYFYFYAGNAKGVSALSAVQSLMCA